MFKTKYLLLLFIAFSTFIQPQAILASDNLSYDTSPDSLIFSYHVIPSELIEQDQTPRIRIYGDGKALIHYSKVYKKAGSYRLKLTNSEMQEIMQLVSDNGILNFDKQTVLRSKQEADINVSAKKKASSQPQVTSITMDQDITQIYYNVQESSSANGTTLGKTSKSKKINYLGLRGDTQKYPNISAIQGLSQVDSWFKGLTNRPDLQKINTP